MFKMIINIVVRILYKVRKLTAPLEYRIHKSNLKFCDLHVNHLKSQLCIAKVSAFFQIFDESWSAVRFMGVLGLCEWLGFEPIPVEDNAPVSKRVEIAGDKATIKSAERTKHRWVVLKCDRPVGPRYAVEFHATVFSVFTELQFAINFRSIADRDRFMIVDNREMIFQSVWKGNFLPPLLSKPCSLPMGQATHFRIDVDNDAYKIAVDGGVVMAFLLPSRPAPEDGRFAFIFFEKSSDREIHAQISDFKLFLPVAGE